MEWITILSLFYVILLLSITDGLIKHYNKGDYKSAIFSGFILGLSIAITMAVFISQHEVC